jgi:hypothetical protein
VVDQKIQWLTTRLLKCAKILMFDQRNYIFGLVKNLIHPYTIVLLILIHLRKDFRRVKVRTNFKSIYIWTNLSSHGQLAILTREIGASLAVCLVDGDSTTPRPLQANGRVPPQQSKQTQISVCQIKHGVASTEIHKGGHRPSLPPVPSRDPMASEPDRRVCAHSRR